MEEPGATLQKKAGEDLATQGLTMKNLVLVSTVDMMPAESRAEIAVKREGED